MNEIIPVIILIVVFLFIAMILVGIDNKSFERLYDKKDKEMSEKGLSRYDVIVKYMIVIYKVVNGEKYYLWDDNNFYTDSSYPKVKEFTSKYQLNEYIRQFDSRLREKYGSDIKYSFRYITRTTDYCKKL